MQYILIFIGTIIIHIIFEWLKHRNKQREQYYQILKDITLIAALFMVSYYYFYIVNIHTKFENNSYTIPLCFVFGITLISIVADCAVAIQKYKSKKREL